MRRNARNHSQESLYRSRELRSGMSISEKVLWEKLRRGRVGAGFRRQVRVEGYYLDFYCAKAKVCLEVDGEQHALRRAADDRRDETLARLGIKTVRIPSLDLFEESGKLHLWVERIAALVEQRVADLHPPAPSSISRLPALYC